LSAPRKQQAPPQGDTRPAGFVLAGMQGSSGKTVLTCLLLAALEQRGLSVQPFKAGPDYIDPGYHNRYASRPSRNLDAWLMGKERVLQEACRHTVRSTGILEGVLGLFDGAHPTSEEGSTMELARWLGWPVVLSVPASKAGRSLAAGLRGFLAEAGPGRIAGVVLVGVSGDSHTEYLREALKPAGVPVLGAVPKMEALDWPERHLGLQAAQEQQLPTRKELAMIAQRTLDLEAFEALARLHPDRDLPRDPAADFPRKRSEAAAPTFKRRRRVGIARDASFHFYYEANLDWLVAQEMELVPFSPLADESLPPGLDSLVIGGGFPEVFAPALSQNTPLLRSLREAVLDGMPCYAECGGLMLLSEAIVTLDGGRFPMAGLVPGTVEMTRTLQNFGYCSVAQTDGPPPHGHEFHHSRWSAESERANAWEVVRRRNGKRRLEGFRRKNLHASYVHLYFPALAPTLTTSLCLTP
jgi:cobyrinic acid a,c-diamide synthase